jgi:hypothetical protein
MKPSDGEVEFLRAVELRLGAGTRVYVARIEAKKRGEDTEIFAVLEARATVTIADPKKYQDLATCGACGAPAPPPDNDGLWYILQNHDGNRLLFPVPEGEAHKEPERDQYPAPGWKMLGDKVVCSECWEAAHKALKARGKKA